MPSSPKNFFLSIFTLITLISSFHNANLVSITKQLFLFCFLGWGEVKIHHPEMPNFRILSEFRMIFAKKFRTSLLKIVIIYHICSSKPLNFVFNLSCAYIQKSSHISGNVSVLFLAC